MSDDGFQPFGYRVELLSKLPPDEFKAKAKSRLSGWLEMKPGPRGWIAGPVICLWHEAFRRGGPVLIARIETNTFGSAIVGRAGFSLFMAVLAALALPVTVLMAMSILVSTEFSIRSLLFPALLVGVPGALLWSSHAFRREADPLVRFLERLDKPVTSRMRKTSAKAARSFDHLTLTIDGKDQARPVTADMIERALQELDAGGFMIVASADETYMQVAELGEEFVIERRDGDRHSHFQATHADGSVGHSSEIGQTFDYEPTLAALLAYAGGMPMPPSIAWKKLKL